MAGIFIQVKMPVFYLGEEIMAKKSNQKLKILYLAKILNENTNDDNGITMPQIIEKLESYGISADRKTIYMDIEELRNYGMDILSEKRGAHYYYFVGSRLFELAELKLLVDSVQSAKFITEKKSKELIKKLGELASKQDASQLNRQVYRPRKDHEREHILQRRQDTSCYKYRPHHQIPLFPVEHKKRGRTQARRGLVQHKPAESHMG